ncbi:MAG: antitoxin family protein [Chloroflexota bacterium]|nr:antitoxin family protein [Chloroflexota bacterium]
MSRWCIEVVYENGIFRPLHPVELPEGAVGEVHIELPSTRSTWREDDQAERGNAVNVETATEPQDRERSVDSPGQRAYRLLMEIAVSPHAALDERTDISARHDDILYPKHGKMP